MLNEADALKQLESGDFAFPPFQLVEISTQLPPSNVCPDWVLVLRWGAEQERFVVEYKSLSTPKRVQEAINQARHLAQETGLRPMVMTPYLDEDTLDRLAELEVSALDFSGNGVVVVPGSWFVYRAGKPNAYPATQYIKAIYRGRSSLVARTLLLQPTFETVTAVQQEIERREGQVSLGTVSKVLKSLEERLIVSRADGVTLVQPDRLLDELAESFEPPTVTDRFSCQVEDLQSTMKELGKAADEFNLRLAARGERVYTFFPGSEQTLVVYTEDLPSLVNAIPLEESRRFSNLQLLEAEDETVYFDRRSREGFFWTSPVQVYLELVSGGKREQEVAKEMRASLLAGEYT